jgi:hypothetical protein
VSSPSTAFGGLRVALGRARRQGTRHVVVCLLFSPTVPCRALARVSVLAVER